MFIFILGMVFGYSLSSPSPNESRANRWYAEGAARQAELDYLSESHKLCIINQKVCSVG